MQLDKTALDRLLSLDDETLKKTITSLAAAAGIDPRAAQSAVSNLRLVRASLSNATDADIARAANMIGKEKVESMMENLNKSENTGGGDDAG